jgi:hypothetical protein
MKQFTGNSFAELYHQDTAKGDYAFMLMYPSTAAWSKYPNKTRYIIQDGNEEHQKVGFDKVCQREAWKNISVLGSGGKGVLIAEPPPALLNYWQETWNHEYNFELLTPENYCDRINASTEKIITLFPYDGLLPERHAVNPDKHYFLLSKLSLNQVSPLVPAYQEHHFSETHPNDVNLPKVFPYVIKTSHGLSGEGTYLIRSETDLENCRKEFRAYWGLQLVEAVVVSDFVQDVVDNYCVQFYVNKEGEITVLGATHQLVSEQGVYLGGLIHYEHTNLQQFEAIITHTAAFAHQHGYFGVIGVDVLEDKHGKLHVIDANVRINGSTAMCLQKHDLLQRGKETAKYAGNWVMEGTEAEVIQKLKEHLKRRDFTILSALYYPETRLTAIYGIVAGENYDDLLKIEQQMGALGLRQTA